MALLGLAMANWAGRFPVIREMVMGRVAIGLVLICSAIGGLCGRFGSGAIVGLVMSVLVLILLPHVQ